jgi:hypothetical protein
MCTKNESGVLMTDGEILKLIIDIKDELKEDIGGVYDAIGKVQETQIKHGEAIAVIKKTLDNGINTSIAEIKERVSRIEQLPIENRRRWIPWAIAGISSTCAIMGLILKLAGII